MKRNIIYIIVVFMAFLTGCQDVPITGRQQFNLVPDSTINQMARESYKEFLAEAEISKDSSKVAMVNRVGTAITKAVDRYGKRINIDPSDFAWEIQVVEDKAVNAWCMPGGKIVVYTGLLEVADTDDKLAVVIGHEIAHALAKHGAERMTGQLAVAGTAMAVGYTLKDESEKNKKAFMTAFAIGSQFGVLLPFSRKHEYEADEIGLLLSTLAGFNPDSAVDFWLSMSEKSGGHEIDFFSTHPADSKRIARIKEIIPGIKRKTDKIRNQ